MKLHPRFISASRILAMAALMASTSAQSFELTSKDIKANQTLNMQQVFNGFGCKGANQSPQLSWHNAPKGTKSFAIMAYDPDAPTGSGWWHWVAFNIPATTNHLPTNASQTALQSPIVQSRTDFGSYGYGGACPPPQHGPHRYQFTVFALKVQSLPLDRDASAAMVGFMVRQHSLGAATIEATYQR